MHSTFLTVEDKVYLAARRFWNLNWNRNADTVWEVIGPIYHSTLNVVKRNWEKTLICKASGGKSSSNLWKKLGNWSDLWGIVGSNIKKTMEWKGSLKLVGTGNEVKSNLEPTWRNWKLPIGTFPVSLIFLQIHSQFFLSFLTSSFPRFSAFLPKDSFHNFFPLKLNSQFLLIN